MSNSPGGTHMDHASRPKYRVWQKLVKNAHFFIKYELFIEKKNMIFCFKNLIFFRIWVSYNKLLLRMTHIKWHMLSKEKLVLVFCYPIISENSIVFECFGHKSFRFNYCYLLLQKHDIFYSFLEKYRSWACCCGFYMSPELFERDIRDSKAITLRPSRWDDLIISPLTFYLVNLTVVTLSHRIKKWPLKYSHLFCRFWRIYEFFSKFQKYKSCIISVQYFWE